MNNAKNPAIGSLSDADAGALRHRTEPQAIKQSAVLNFIDWALEGIENRMAAARLPGCPVLEQNMRHTAIDSREIEMKQESFE